MWYNFSGREKFLLEMEYLNLMKSFCIKDFIKDCIKDLLFLYSFFILDDASMWWEYK